MKATHLDSWRLAILLPTFLTSAALAASVDTWVGGSGSNFSTAANWTYASGAGPVASGDSLVFGSGGALTPNNDENNFTFGGITFNSGGSAYLLGGNPFTLASGGSVLVLGTAAQTINNDIVLSGSGATANLSAGGAKLKLGGHISGSANFTMTGSSTAILTLAGTNLFSGSFVLNAGTVVFTTPPGSSGGSLGNPSGFSFGGSSTSTLQTSSGAGAVRIAAPTITVATNASCQFRNGNSSLNLYEIAAKITGLGNCKQATPVTADNVVRFSNDSNDYTGNFAMQGGVVEFTSVANAGLAAALGGKGSTPYVVANQATAATLRYVGSGNNSTLRALDWQGTTGNLVLQSSSNGTVQFLSSANLKSGSGAAGLFLSGTNTGANTLAQVINDSGGPTTVTKSGGGTWVLSGTNTYTGLTAVSGGTLWVNGRLGVGGVNVTNGTLGGSGSILGAVALGSGGMLAPGTTLIGALTLNSNVTLGGDLLFKVNQSLVPSNDTVVVSGTLTNSGTGTLTVTNLGPALTDGSRFVLFSKPVANGGALTVTGAGVSWTNRLALDGSIAVLPAITTSTDTWVGGTGSNFSTAANWTYSSGSGPLASGDSLVFGSEGASSPNNDENNFTLGGLTFNNGGSAYALGGNPFTLASGGSLLVLGTAAQTINNDIVLSGSGGTANLNAAGASLRLGGRISGSADFTLTGSSTAILTLAGTNTFTGMFMLNAGTVVFTTPPSGSGGNLGNPSGFSFDGSSTSTLQTSSGAGAVTIAAPPITVATNSACQFRNGSSSLNLYEIAGKITGPGNCKQATPVTAGNIVRFSGDSNDYTGNFTMQGGVIEFTSVANAGSAAALGGKGTTPYVIANHTTAATLRYVGSGNNSTLRALDWQGTTGSLILESSGSGTVQFLSSANLKSGSGAAGLSLSGTNPGANTLAQVINDSGGTTTVTKSGAGTWVLSGTNPYAGMTAVNGGTLWVNGQIDVGGVSVTNGTLGGSGVILGPVTLGSAGTLAPGTTLIGALTLNSNVTIGGNLLFKVHQSVFPSNDTVVVSGSLTNTSTGTLTVTNLGAPLTGGSRFVLFSKPVANGGALTVTGAGVTWTNRLAVDGSIAVLPVIATTRTNITLAYDGTNVTVTWPVDHIGWHLQVQTNSLSIGLTTNWVTISGSDATNFFQAPVSRTNKTVFYRLVYP
jgi:autotransporter-associated beta strand protein